MITLETDTARNIVKISFSGHVTVDEVRRHVANVGSALAGVKPGFRLLTDLTELEVMDVACMPEMQRVMDLCNEAGVKQVVRIIPDPHKDIGLNIMSFFHYRRGIQIVTCETMAEAMAVLSDS
jgi:hypothetical protein